tara:strand:+ start:38 stop:511 length:474 start_codon:yes stop_codon:yes gene_type:complete
MSLTKRHKDQLVLIKDLASITDSDIPGYNTPTGEAAAKSMVDAAASLRGRIYWQLLNNGPMTSQEVARRIMQTHNGVWQRMSELQRKGVIQYAGENRKNTSGRYAKVWEVRTEEGLDPELLEKLKHSKEAMRNEIARLKVEIARLKSELIITIGTIR